ncbi:DMT family transporter [Methylobacterium brachythecii]|uniref:Drug/metabolite transporter (DMT)-like permease n=1 Tax=Methylobacterium brachythecii TaxID=1176177 RepID=A0A7W6AKY5_9HYPH|nr:DMT family transporter [Methylobacterium brachythecii]MBB3901667.1 drug/metabolite transporter (DMT)-like permease [Methylobacterium brachythecii]GLS43976.1 peptide ABC transporter ATP-binding protein [Methylobacterium brachythecii]
MPRTPISLPTTLIPGLFVVIWATGFVTARLVAPHAEPLAFVAVRVVVTALVLAAISLVSGVPWPSRRGTRNALIAGVLMQGFYVAGVFWSVHRGLPAGIAALVGSLQPLLTAAIAGPLLGERVAGRRWAGIGAGFLGAGLVLAPKLGAVDASGIPPVALVACLGAMVAMTLGTLWQKRTGASTDLLANATIQFTGASLLMLPLAALAGDWKADLGWPLALGFTWSVLGNSVAGILLLMALIRRGAVAGVASLLFLVPPVSALMAYALFGEALSPIQIGGMTIAAVGVALASRS